jgi:hypothetical protein
VISCRTGIVVLLIGCGAGADDGVIGACVSENSPSEPFDVGDVQGLAMPAPEPGGAPIVLPPPTAADIAQDCRDGGGSGCDEHDFISRDAATCIARASRLEAGIRPWSTALGYYSNHQRVAWGIMTVREMASDGYWGEYLVLDATSGEELARSSYDAEF